VPRLEKWLTESGGGIMGMAAWRILNDGMKKMKGVRTYIRALA
jgi:hypothetical protein